jgi:hypothetical protein
MRKRTKAILLSIVTFALGCVFIAGYDPRIDSGATELQQKVGTFLTDLEQTTGAPEGEYERHIGFYEEVRTDISVLRTVASAHKGNDLTLQSLDLVEANVAKLEKLHAEGISREEIGIVRSLFDTQFRMLVQLENAKKRKES